MDGNLIFLAFFTRALTIFFSTPKNRRRLCHNILYIISIKFTLLWLLLTNELTLWSFLFTQQLNLRSFSKWRAIFNAIYSTAKNILLHPSHFPCHTHFFLLYLFIYFYSHFFRVSQSAVEWEKLSERDENREKVF